MKLGELGPLLIVNSHFPLIFKHFEGFLRISEISLSVLKMDFGTIHL